MLEFARATTDKVGFMDAGEIIETGPPEQLFESPREERTKRFLEHILLRRFFHESA